jgi:hypothetical protein
VKHTIRSLVSIRKVVFGRECKLLGLVEVLVLVNHKFGLILQQVWFDSPQVWFDLLQVWFGLPQVWFVKSTISLF